MKPPPGSGESSPDQSSCSSDPGDVLVRSTRVLLSDRRHEAGPGPGSVQITVQRLRDPPAQHQRSGTERRPEHRQRPSRAAPLRAAERAQPGESSGRCPRSTGDLDPVVIQRGQREPDRWALKKPGPPPGPGPGLTKENRKPPAAESPDRKLDDQTQSDRQPGQELLTSCFAAGGRGVVLAALKQRSHSAPHRRKVKVQLLDSRPLQNSSQDALGEAGVQMVADLSSGRPGDASNAASACCVETRSDLEVRVSQLANEVQRLLQADREGGDQRRSLSQQTLHHLETLQSHQLQLQSQLLESALRIVTGHAHVTSTISDITAPGQLPHLQVTHLDTAENVLSNQQRNSSATRAAAATVEMDPVAMATPRRDRWPDQTRADQYLQGAPSVSTATQTAAGSHLQSSANHSQTVAKTANEMLREMGRLKSEIKILLTQPEDSLKTTRPGPEHSHSQQNHFQSLQSKSQQSKSQQTETRQVQSQQNQSQSQQNQSQSQSQPNQTHQTKPQLSQQSPSVLVQRRPLVPSMLEEAGQVLRQVRRQKKVLEENLESLLRAKTGEVLHCQLEALSADRDSTQEVRIKKTVDAWISSLTEDIQAEMSSEDTVRRPADAVIKPSASRDAAVTSQRSAGSSAHTGRGGPVSALRRTGSKTAAGSGGRTAGRRPGAEPDRPTGGLSDGEQVEGGAESYLTRLYGRAPYEGLRRTLKKSPYLRLSSQASPLGRKPRPRLVESVRGVKVKSCKTQTCLAPPLGPSPGPPPHHYIISSSHLTSGDLADLRVTPTCAVPMAIPLGRPRMDSSRCLAEHQQEVTSPPTAPPTSGVVGVDGGASELQSQEAEHLEAGEAPPPPADITERKSEEDEEEENAFPGTDFLSVADVVQEEEEEEEEEEEGEGEGVSVVGEEAVELDGGPSPPPVLYQGPAFPPRALSSLPAQDQASVPGLGLQRDVLENRLVEWVEQQLMSRMISEMYRPPPSDPAQNDSADQSEREEQSVTSDIVEAAGGLQLFVDVSVDSALIRQLVHEVLTEHVALMLGHRDKLEAGPRLEPPKPGPGAHQKDNLVPLVLTPVPTPPPSPTPSSREAPPLTTPPPSEPTSLLNEESPQPITAAEPVATPTSSPEPAHSAGSPPDVHQAPPPLTWGDAELPLDEERPEEHLDTHPPPLVMSVAEEEPPLSSPLPPPPFIPPPPSPSPPPPSPDPRPVSPSSSSESSTSSTSSSSSSAVTAGTEAALRHISEGELLISVNRLAAMTEDEPVCSFSSSLQELQEMDFDPPSEGQVRGHDLLLTLLTKMEQGVTQRGERPQPEGSWGESQEEEVSVGEVRDDRTTNPKSLSRSAAAQQGQSSSPGQISQCADVPEVHFEATNQGSAVVGDLMVEPMGTLTSDLQTDLSLSPPPHLENTGQGVPVLVRQSHRRTVEQQQEGTRKMAVHLPSIRPEEEEVEVEVEVEVEEEEVIERSPCAAADTDSSMNDDF